MAKSVCRVVHKPDHEKSDEYIVIVHQAEYKKWKAGDTTIPLADVVDSFEIFHSSQGSQGLLGKPSKQQLDTAFGTHKDVDVITVILGKGKEQAGDAIRSGSFTMNLARGSAVIDNKGKGSVIGGV